MKWVKLFFHFFCALGGVRALHCLVLRLGLFYIELGGPYELALIESVGLSVICLPGLWLDLLQDFGRWSCRQGLGFPQWWFVLRSHLDRGVRSAGWWELLFTAFAAVLVEPFLKTLALPFAEVYGASRARFCCGIDAWRWSWAASYNKCRPVVCAPPIPCHHFSVLKAVEDKESSAPVQRLLPNFRHQRQLQI